ncbi:MAG: hypothetical protein KU37_07495 [Sulfuricurvum sp. PC08-66]|nr:MAG: hypothetical protein KU37_07495 [Sulfuricurvum sp. PC08-66]
MRLFVALFLALIVISGCAPHFGQESTPADKKAYLYEDSDIFLSILLDEAGEFAQSAQLFAHMYTKSKKSEYMLERFRRLFRIEAYEQLLSEVEVLLAQSPKHVELLRFHIAALHALGQTQSALKSAHTLVEITQAPQDFKRVAGLYAVANEFAKAVHYLQEAYAQESDEDILLDYTSIMYLKQGDKKGAVTQLESHSRIHGCSVKVCERLAGFYSDMDDLNGQVATYKRLYALTQEAQYAQAVVKAYSYNRNILQLTLFLEESAFDDDLLLRLYMEQNAYEKSIGLSKRLYDQTKSPHFQAQYAIALYLNAAKATKKVLATVVENLKESVAQEPRALYLNYLGYLLIDHEIDVQGGIAYVNAALALEADSAFYLDSLAWGYYKQKECKKALGIIQKAQKLIDTKEPEIEAHYQAIQNCIKGTK